MEVLIRLNKLMAHRGLCSRREADRFIQAGLVLVNGEKISHQPGLKVPSGSAVSILPEGQAGQDDKVSIALHKPMGYVSTQPEKGYLPAVRLLTWSNFHGGMANRRRRRIKTSPAPKDFEKLGVCGRLDIHSTGLLVLTQDGRIAQKLMQPQKFPVEKEYLVRFSCDLTHESRAIERLRHPIWDQDEELRAVSVDILNSNQLRIVLNEGKNHHIRRMCRSVGLDLIALKRVRIGSVVLGDLPVGKWTFLNPSLINEDL